MVKNNIQHPLNIANQGRECTQRTARRGFESMCALIPCPDIDLLRLISELVVFRQRPPSISIPVSAWEFGAPHELKLKIIVETLNSTCFDS